MNKRLTKLLSVFVIAGAIGTGTAIGLAGCKKEPTHTHTAATEWQHDDTDHWHNCTANDGKEMDKASHSYDDDLDADCNVCGYVRTVTYSITYEGIEGITGTNTNPTSYTSTGSAITLAAVEKDYYTFDGWYNGETKVTTIATGTTGNLTLTARWIAKTYRISYTGLEGISGTNDNPTSYNIESDTITLNPVTKEGYLFDGWYNADGEKVTTIESGSTGNLALEARWLEPVEISSVADFLEFRQTAEPVGLYKLTTDLDLTGVTLDAPLAVLGANAIFDGQGHVIKNASYTNAGAKTGLLCASINGGKVTNVKFLGCAVSSSNESAGIVAGTVEGVSTLTKIEFNSCSVATTGNYVGLLFARNEKGNADITIEEVTAKNGCTTACAAYGGFLMGDMQTTSKVSFKDLDVAGELQNSTQNASFIAGRTRGGEVSVENAVISAKMPTGITSMGIFSANGSLTNLTIKNVLILESNISNLYQSSKAPAATDISGLYTVAGVTVDQASATGENTVAFLTDTLGFDFANVWTAEGENNANYRLAAASTNVKSADAVITNIKVSASNAKTRFKAGEEFVATGLNVMASYSDGVQLVLNFDASEGATDGYVVDASEFNKDAAGTYTITVKSNEDGTKIATYEVTVVEQTGFVVIDEFMTHTYLTGAKLDTTNLVVKSVWSDGVEEKLAASEFTIDSSSYNMTQVGEQTVRISSGTFGYQTVTISVVNSKPVPVDGKVYVNVDAASTVANGAKVNGVETFKTLTDAIDYLEACNLDSAVTKVLYVAEGTYEEKITTSLDNLVLVGEGTDKSVLTYSAVESTVNPVTGAQYSLNCATLHVNGEGFRAYNIAIRNDFDYKNEYKNESSPQGLALTINGDQAVLQNVYLYGNQDTLYLKSGRTYIKDSRIDGNIDFIFGEAKGLAYFDNCQIVAISKYNTPDSNNGYVTAMKATDADKPDYGYIFDNCEFTDDGTLLEGSMSLGRPWGAKATVAYINCSFSAAYSTAAYDGKTKSRWFDMSGNSPVNADFCEYGSTGAGAITEAVDGGRILTADEAANYTKANIFAATNGLCTWSAAWDCDAAVTALAELTGATVAPTEIYVSAETIEVEAGNTTDLYLGVAPWNANDKEVTVTVADESIATWANGVLTGVAEGTTTITVSKDGLESKTVTVKVTPAQAPVGTTYTYTYGGENGSEWVTDVTNSNTSLDTTPVPGLKVEYGKIFNLEASGTKATITLNGFTTATSNATGYVTVTFKDASGNVLGTLTGTTTAGKVVGDFTFTSNGVFESDTAFATIEISCNTSGKHFSIVSVSIEVE